MESHSMPAFRALIENSPDATFLVKAAGEVLYASASTSKVLGYSPEEVVGRNAFDLIHPEDRDNSRRAVRDVLADPPGPSQLDSRVRQKNGQWSWMENTISNLLDDRYVQAIVFNWREIGARRADKEKQRRYTEELARCNEKLEQVADAVAHDLREPLLTISMFTSLLVKQSHLDARGMELAKFVADGVTRMAALLEGLHTFALRGSTDSPEPLDLEKVFEEVLKDLGQAIASTGAVVTAGPLPWVKVAGQQLPRVFQNLIGNAIKYRGAAPIEIHVTAERLESDWVIRVKDNGIGIAPEYQERVFRLLKRLHGQEIPGSGLGLAICKKIVEESGGKIWVESKLGAGSTFCFTVAAVEESELSAFPAAKFNLNGTSANGGEPSPVIPLSDGVQRAANGD